MERRPVPGEFYRHFKNKYYQIVGIAKYSETKEEMVVYQALYDDFSMYVRPLWMFVSEVDHVKYPSVTQKYRFEKVEASQIGEIVDTGYAEGAKTPGLQTDRMETSPVVTGEKVEKEPETIETAEVSDGEVNPILMQFLDEETYDDKLKYLNAVQKKLTDDIIDAMAASIDVIVPEGDINSRYLSLRNCLAAHVKYEVTRPR